MKKDIPEINKNTKKAPVKEIGKVVDSPWFKKLRESHDKEEVPDKKED